MANCKWKVMDFDQVKKILRRRSICGQQLVISAFYVTDEA
jgi:hypothetical protein